MTNTLRSPRYALSLVLLLGAVGCDSGATEPEVEALPGSYDLISMTQQGQPTAMAPIVSGTLVLTDSRYDLDLSINMPGMEMDLVDTGSYSTLSGNEWRQVSDVSGEALGTYRLANGILTVDVPYQGTPVVMIWARSS